MQKNKHILILIIGALLLSGISFYGGIKYSANKRMANFRNFTGRGEQMIGDNLALGQRGVRGGLGNNITGEIISKDENTITVKLRDGGSRILFISGKTLIFKSASSTKDELIEGLQITGFGSANPDGSINAENIQIR